MAAVGGRGRRRWRRGEFRARSDEQEERAGGGDTRREGRKPDCCRRSDGGAKMTTDEQLAARMEMSTGRVARDLHGSLAWLVFVAAHELSSSQLGDTNHLLPVL